MFRALHHCMHGGKRARYHHSIHFVLCMLWYHIIKCCAMSWILRHDMRIVSSVQFLVTRSIVMQCEHLDKLIVFFVATYSWYFCHCTNSPITAQSRVITAHFVYHCTVFYALRGAHKRATFVLGTTEFRKALPHCVPLLHHCAGCLDMTHQQKWSRECVE